MNARRVVLLVIAVLVVAAIVVGCIELVRLLEHAPVGGLDCPGNTTDGGC